VPLSTIHSTVFAADEDVVTCRVDTGSATKRAIPPDEPRHMMLAPVAGRLRRHTNPVTVDPESPREMRRPPIKSDPPRAGAGQKPVP